MKSNHTNGHSNVFPRSLLVSCCVIKQTSSRNHLHSITFDLRAKLVGLKTMVKRARASATQAALTADDDDNAATALLSLSVREKQVKKMTMLGIGHLDSSSSPKKKQRLHSSNSFKLNKACLAHSHENVSSGSNVSDDEDTTVKSQLPPLRSQLQVRSLKPPPALMTTSTFHTMLIGKPLGAPPKLPRLAPGKILKVNHRPRAAALKMG